MKAERAANKRSEEYFRKLYDLFKKTEGMESALKSRDFNGTEMRLISEIIMERNEGRRLISTHLAKRLGITRSAISQMVNKLEARGIVQRVPDDVDKKIAYVELSPSAEKKYKAERKQVYVMMDRLLERFGTEKLDELLRLNDEFLSVIMEWQSKE